ncbi:MAG: hypothetical protein ACKVX9_13240 [Blastocatellia bacterium]
MVKSRIDITYSILTLTVIISLVFLVMMYRQNEELRASLSKREAAVPGTLSGPPGTMVGDLIPAFSTEDWEGRSFPVRFDGKTRHLFYIFAQGCASCEKQFPQWRKISAKVASPTLRAVGLYLEPEVDPLFMRKHASEKDQLTMIRMPNMAIQRSFRVVMLPQLVLVSPEGVVEWAGLGSLDEGTLESLMKTVARL